MLNTIGQEDILKCFKIGNIFENLELPRLNQLEILNLYQFDLNQQLLNYLSTIPKLRRIVIDKGTWSKLKDNHEEECNQGSKIWRMIEYYDTILYLKY